MDNISDISEVSKPYLKFSINDDSTIEIQIFPKDCTSKHMGALLFMVQSGALSGQMVKCLDSLARETGENNWVNETLIEWFSLVMKVEEAGENIAHHQQKGRNPAIRAREVLTQMSPQVHHQNHIEEEL